MANILPSLVALTASPNLQHKHPLPVPSALTLHLRFTSLYLRSEEPGCCIISALGTPCGLTACWALQHATETRARAPPNPHPPHPQEGSFVLF